LLPASRDGAAADADRPAQGRLVADPAQHRNCPAPGVAPGPRLRRGISGCLGLRGHRSVVPAARARRLYLRPGTAGAVSPQSVRRADAEVRARLSAVRPSDTQTLRTGRRKANLALRGALSMAAHGQGTAMPSGGRYAPGAQRVVLRAALSSRS